jgi:deoxycytidine triphosphate deaminase
MGIVVVNTDESTTFLSNIDKTCQQQAAVDLRLENVWKMEGLFTIDEDVKYHRKTTKVDVDEEGYYYLSVGSYEISFDHDISIGPDEASLIVTRSTLARNGVFVASGLWDPKFSGRGGCCLHVNGGLMKIKPGTRIGQFVTWKVVNAQGAYNGSYGLNTDGSPKEMEKKYHK